ncbi:hypothetical protein ECG_07963 [Echinococcus granulosus]|nr:hypothetical protein ECG_07963 [Echinococcus granulosus]
MRVDDFLPRIAYNLTVAASTVGQPFRHPDDCRTIIFNSSAPLIPSTTLAMSGGCSSTSTKAVAWTSTRSSTNHHPPSSSVDVVVGLVNEKDNEEQGEGAYLDAGVENVMELATYW